MWVAAGILLLLVLFFDVFLTVFHAQGKPGPLTHVQSRTVWSLFRRLGSGKGGRLRPKLLSFAAPLMIVLTLMIWVVLLTAGFACIYYRWIADFLMSPGEMRSPWIEALYFSGYTGATLGFGDLVPDIEALRLLAPVHAFGGFALVSVSTTYLLATYRELIMMRSVAVKIATHFRTDGRHSSTFDDVHGCNAMAQWAEDATDLLNRTLQAHFQYPILHYFYAGERQRALPVQLGRLLDLRDVMSGADPDDPGARAFRHASFLSLYAMVDEYLSDVGNHFVPARFNGEMTDGPNGRANYRRLLSYMCYESSSPTT